MKKKQKKKLRILIICAAAAVLVLIIVLIIQGVRRLTAPQVDTAEGVEYIRSEEATDISSVGEKISRLEQQAENTEDTRSIRERFSASAVMGDSIAAGFTAYDVLSPASVIAENSVLLSDMDAQVERAAVLQPQIIFLSYGLNDVTQEDGDADTFTGEYRAFIEKLKTAVPNAHIFVNSILPVRTEAIESEPLYENIAGYNTALEEMCSQLQVGYIDNTSLIQDEYYEPDGIHFQAEFYSVWAQRMAEVAAL